MKTPESLETLVEHGIIQEVIRPLMSGKEAQVYVVIAGGRECVRRSTNMPTSARSNTAWSTPKGDARETAVISVP
jgi:serine/threonine-protein kinase RIO1